MVIGREACLRQAQTYAAYVTDVTALHQSRQMAGVQAVASLSQEWTQICAGQRWSSTHIESSDTVETLCLQYASSNLIQQLLDIRSCLLWFESAAEAARRQNDVALLINFKCRVATVLGSLGEEPRAESLLLEARHDAEAISDDTLLSDAIGHTGLLVGNRGNIGSALEYFERAASYAYRAKAYHHLGQWLMEAAVCYHVSGNLKMTQTRLRQAAMIAREHGDRTLEARCLEYEGGVFVGFNAYSLAIKRMERALAIVRQEGNRRAEAVLLAKISVAYSLTKTRSAQALHSAQEAVTFSEAAGDLHLKGMSLCMLAKVQKRHGAFEAALDSAHAALDLGEQLQSAPLCYGALLIRGDIYIGMKAYAQAVTAFEQTVAVAKAGGIHQLVSQAEFQLRHARYKRDGNWRRWIPL